MNGAEESSGVVVKGSKSRGKMSRRLLQLHLPSWTWSWTKSSGISSMIMSWTICGALLLVLLPPAVLSFPDGAPGGETCVKHRPNHGATSQPLSTLPYLVEASGSEYKKDSTIAG